MSDSTLPLTPELLGYLQAHSVHEPPLLRQLREETHQKFEAAPMQICPEQGQFFRWLLPLLNAKKVLEIGTFTGYSSICMALALPDDGHLTCCDLSNDWTEVARKYWHEMGLADKISLHLQPAVQTLNELLDEGHQDSYDFAFIDADKPNYVNYYELCFNLVRPGGVIAIDNVLWGGAVIDPDNEDGDTQAIKKLNEHIHQDTRVSSCMVPIGDGVTLATKK